MGTTYIQFQFFYFKISHLNVPLSLFLNELAISVFFFSIHFTIIIHFCQVKRQLLFLSICSEELNI